MNSQTHTLDEVRDMLMAEARAVAPSRLRSGVSQWCVAHGVNRHHVNEFINGKRGPTSDILDALGLEWAIATRRVQP